MLTVFVTQSRLRNCVLIIDHKFSIGFQSGESPGQCNVLSFLDLKNSVLHAGSRPKLTLPNTVEYDELKVL